MLSLVLEVVSVREHLLGVKPEVVPRISMSCLGEAGTSRHKGLKVGKMLVDSTSDFL